MSSSARSACWRVLGLGKRSNEKESRENGSLFFSTKNPETVENGRVQRRTLPFLMLGMAFAAWFSTESSCLVGKPRKGGSRQVFAKLCNRRSETQFRRKFFCLLFFLRKVNYSSSEASSRRVTARLRSSSCLSSTKSGQLVMGSLAFWTLGKAMTSRMDSAPAISMHRRSRP